MDMTSHRLFLLVAVGALCAQVSLAETTKDKTKAANYEKPKRDVSIIGPVPTNYRGQASGRTTFDGVLADDLQLPAVESGRFRDQSFPQFGGSAAQSAAPSVRFQFQAESRPDVYNYDGKEQYTYDGVLASDLTVPYTHFSVVSQSPRAAPAQGQYLGQRLSQAQRQSYQPQTLFEPTQPVLRQANFQDDLTLPPAGTDQLQAYQRDGTFPSSADPSLFTPETPTERYNRLQQQYQATLAEYRSSLLRFREQLKKYSNIS